MSYGISTRMFYVFAQVPNELRSMRTYVLFLFTQFLGFDPVLSVLMQYSCKFTVTVMNAIEDFNSKLANSPLDNCSIHYGESSEEEFAKVQKRFGAIVCITFHIISNVST